MNISTNTPNAYNKSLNSTSFQRHLRDDEKPEFSKTMNEAFDYLGLDNRALIIHGSSFPSKASQNLRGFSSDYSLSVMNGKNPYIGSPYFAKDFIDFAKMNGFNAIQLGPTGKLNKRDNSPYHASIFAKNELFLSYDELKTDNYANILSNKDLRDIKIIKKKYHNNYEMSDFDEAQTISKIVTHKAYTNFKTKLADGDVNAKKLNNEFIQFKLDNRDWLDKDCTFRLFSDIHGTDNFEKWDNELDKTLITRIAKGDEAAAARYNQVKTLPGNREKTEEYKFVQFLVDKQEKEDKELRAKEGMKYIGDLLVGYSYADEWSNPDAFLKDWRVGCPDGGKNNGPQLWNIAVLNPKTLFNEDGSLGTSGKVLKRKIERTIDGVENVRVDNVMGLVDPYIYKSSAVKKDGTIDYSDRNFLSYTGVDPKHNYSKIMHDILLPTLREHGINPKDVVWEDLGAQSDTFRDVFYNGKYEGQVFEDEKLQGIMYAKGCKMENERGSRYSFLSTHDNEPTAHLLEQSWIYGNEGWNPMYLAGYLKPPYNEENAKKSSEFCKEIEQNPQTRLKAKYAELFRGTSNIQLTFADLFGIDKTYNVAGQEVKDNWKLKLNSNYEDTYYASCISEDKPVMNMPELLGIAVGSKAGMAIAKKEQTEEEVNREVSDLQARLSHWEKVLREPEEW
ncbi:MAG: 4-alpha-glucanotransferase [Candidatus Gastranaerophilales bacterium]|nr:4-alpha-glucanotransferase [Candidatus Gastranaerophilales bacterium]